MGSSPVTATNRSAPAETLAAVAEFFRAVAPLEPGDGVVVAFSGGPDSTALLWALSRLAPPSSAAGGVRLTAAHLDHGADPGSAGRAVEAAALARRLGVRFVAERREVPALLLPGETLESAGRRVRYAFLEEVRRREGARWVATAHHRDDQAETVVLRLLFGTGLEGLAGIRPVRGRVVRPLLALPRAALAAAVEAAGLDAVEDPTNRDPALARNRVRHFLLPALAAAEPGRPQSSEQPCEQLAERLAGLAGRARQATELLADRLARVLDARSFEGGASLDRAAFERLDPALQPFALAALHRRSGAPHPAGRPARGELLRQLGRGRASLDCGQGWRWETTGFRLALRRGEEPPPDFSYTLEIPGEVKIPELSLVVAVTRRPVAPWMLRGAPDRAGLDLPLEPGDRVVIRNRRPGDRIHPLGGSGSRRLKEVLIDRRVPRLERDRLPLLCVPGPGRSDLREGRIAWVPGVTIDEEFRLEPGGAEAWVAEVRREMNTLNDLEHVEPLFDAGMVRDSVAALGRRLDEEIGEEDPILLALLGGSVIFLADLVRAIERPLRFELIDVDLRTGASTGPEAEPEVVRIHYPIPVDLEGQSLLVLKDVVSSAVTEPYLEQQLRDRGARTVRFAALIDVPEARKTEFNPHYRALEARRGGILVGYGLKHEGRYGNLPFVGRLSEDAR